MPRKKSPKPKHVAKTSADKAETRAARLQKVKAITNATDADGKHLRARLHHELMSGLYPRHFEGLLKDQPERAMLQLGAPALMQDLTDSIKPRDIIEQMLVHHTAWAHARTAHLSLLTVQATQLESIDRLSVATERASNTFRKLMLGLAEYRRSPRPPANVTSIQQANIAHQQVVQNQPPAGEIEKTDERTRIKQCPSTPQTLPQQPEATSPSMATKAVKR